MDIKDKTEEHSDSESTIYELGYHLIPTVGDENIGTEVEKIKKNFEALKATIISEQLPHLIDLAYEMKKDISNKRHIFLKAYFGWIKFELEPDSVLQLKENLEQNDSLLRFLIIKTVRENTLVPKKPLAKTGSYKKRREPVATKEEKVEKEIDKEAVDKKIEELVLEE